MDIVFCLHLVDILEDSLSVDGEEGVLIAQSVDSRIIGMGVKASLHQFDVMLLAINDIQLSLVHLVFQVGLVRLSIEDVDDALHGIGLVLLYLKL